MNFRNFILTVLVGGLLAFVTGCVTVAEENQSAAPLTVHEIRNPGNAKVTTLPRLCKELALQPATAKKWNGINIALPGIVQSVTKMEGNVRGADMGVNFYDPAEKNTSAQAFADAADSISLQKGDRIRITGVLNIPGSYMAKDGCSFRFERASFAPLATKK